MTPLQEQIAVLSSSPNMLPCARPWRARCPGGPESGVFLKMPAISDNVGLLAHRQETLYAETRCHD